jgi:uncharacterized protein YcfJ
MKASVLLLVAVTAAAGTVVHADSTTDAAVGGALGGAAGAAIGDQLGGRNGAILGGAIGGAAGTAIATEPDGRDGPRREMHRQTYYRERAVPVAPYPRHNGFCPPGQRKKGNC